MLSLTALQSLAVAVAAGLLAAAVYLTGASALDAAFERRGEDVARAIAASEPASWSETRGSELVATGEIMAFAIGKGDASDLRPEKSFSRGASFDAKTAKRFLARQAVPGATDVWAEVVLSREASSRKKGRLLTLTIALWLLAVGIGTGAAYGVLMRVVGPVRRLTGEIRAILVGQADRRVRTTGPGEIGRLASSLNEMAKGLAAGRVIREEQEEVGRELALGAEIQSALLPERIPMLPGIDIGAYYRPCGEIGGDYYDFLELGGGVLGLGIFDVSGHGVPGAIVMGMVKSLLHEVAPGAGGPGATLRRLNAALHRDLRRGMFITGVYAELDRVSRRIRLANAGHNPILIHRGSTRRLEQLKPGGPALGLADADRFDKALKEAEASLDLGDRVVLYTDGALEIANPQGEQYGEKRFDALVGLHAAHESNAFVNLLVEELETYRGEMPPDDDMTIITFAMTV
jgi:serine phosphatase RsbU (regulator of sigma subunit)